MNTSNKVDVVIATGDRTEVHQDVDSTLSVAVEAVDVAPDPNRRIIVLAPTKAAGQAHAESLGIEPVAIVTPRSPQASYGITADEIVEAPDLTADVVAELMSQAGPSLATSGLVRDYLTPVHSDQEPAVLTLSRAHAARRASTAERPLSART